MEKASRRLRIINFNLWHGLNHNLPLLLPPVETVEQREDRFEATIALLKEQILESEDPNENCLTVFCFQEINPLHKKANRIQESLLLDGSHCAEGNVGMRLGNLSFPFLLQEGLGVLWRGSLQNSQSERIVLSGPFFESKLPILNMPVSAQLKERRVALFVTGEWAGLRVAFITTHLHHGNPEIKESGKRREQELDSIFSHLGPLENSFDFIFLVGDFNSFAPLPEFKKILNFGFEELSLDSQKKSLISWDPKVNALCARTTALSPDPRARAWDNKPNAFDHVFWKSNHPAKSNAKISAKRILDKPSRDGIWLSDHFGLEVTINL